MISRPEELGLRINVQSLGDADKALYELGWLVQQLAKIEAECKLELESVKQRFDSRKVVVIEGQRVTFADRIAQLEELLKE